MGFAPGTTRYKDPDAILPWRSDWTAYLAGAEIVTSTWTLTGPDSALVKVSDSILAGNLITRVVVSGGTLGKVYLATNRITTNETPARTDDRSFKISVKQR